MRYVKYWYIDQDWYGFCQKIDTSWVIDDYWLKYESQGADQVILCEILMHAIYYTLNFQKILSEVDSKVASQ